MQWDASNYVPGTHTITARGTDSKGNTGLSAAVAVTVVAPPPGGCAAFAGGPWLLLGLLALARRRR